MSASDKAIDVAVALIVRDGLVLMGERRRTKIYPLHWEFPGGKLEPGESHEAALRRELNEELGIDAVIGENIYSEIATYSDDMTYAIEFYIVRQWQGEIDNQEFESVGWFDIDGLRDLRHLSGNARILRKLEEGIPR